ncbi:CLUMA_CG009690, isoform A [Clunio marinus]|uniref:CLUMA_CG009690, isoform A n=1 Tax=Clunio marinus TaxID=568069 RepID=A0A1J1I7V1_9DIPT|nr:CLUMA_CG009690, isoform A [Clunio marinus]
MRITKATVFNFVLSLRRLIFLTMRIGRCYINYLTLCKLKSSRKEKRFGFRTSRILLSSLLSGNDFSPPRNHFNVLFSNETFSYHVFPFISLLRSHDMATL